MVDEEKLEHQVHRVVLSCYDRRAVETQDHHMPRRALDGVSQPDANARGGMRADKTTGPERRKPDMTGSRVVSMPESVGAYRSDQEHAGSAGRRRRTGSLRASVRSKPRT